MKTINASEEGYKWVQDPEGYFLIRINRDEKLIEVGFVEFGKSPKPENIKYKIVGKNSQVIRRQIFKMGLISRIDHALSIGEELQKAKTALDLGIEYVQDEELSYDRKGWEFIKNGPKILSNKESKELLKFSKKLRK